MKSIHKEADRNAQMKEERLESVRISQIVCQKQKGKSVTIKKNIVTDDDIHTFQQYLMTMIGYSLSCTTKTDYKKSDMAKFWEQLE